jgi:hypothetical protein
MATKKNSYISAELDFAEKSLLQWREYIEANPIQNITDRWGKKEMPKGGFAHVVTATAEAQIKCVQETLTKYLALLEVVDKLREKEEAKAVPVRGDVQLGSMAEDFLKNRK